MRATENPPSQPVDEEGPSRKITWWRFPALGGVELALVQAGQLPWVLTYDHYAVVTQYRGRCLQHYRGRASLVGPGETLVVEPREVHAGEPQGPCDFSAIVVPIDVVQGLLRDMGLSQMPPLRCTPVASAATDAVRKLVSALVAQAPLATRKAALTELFAAVIAGHEVTDTPGSPAREAREGVRLARTLLDAELGREVSLAELAGVARLSRFHLVRAFRDEVGVPPHRYHLLRRIARAQVLLAAGKAPAIVALELGFADQSHFTRYFRKTLRIAPGMYARLGEP